MTFRSILKAAALSAAALVASGSAQAGFTYTATPTPTTTTFGGSVATLGPVSSVTTLSTPTFINIGDVALTSTTVPPATDTTSITVTDAVAITNVPGAPPGSLGGTAGTGTITVNGTLTFTRSDTGGEVSSFTVNSITNNGANIGGIIYTLSSVTYTPPTVNNVPTGDGNISVLVTATPATTVPEPASLVMMGAGLVSVVGLGVRRSRKA
jgi:hypothetical protein